MQRPLPQESRGGRRGQPAVDTGLDDGRGQNATEWVSATFQDRRHIGRLLARLIEDFRRIMAHERENMDLLPRYEREDEECPA